MRKLEEEKESVRNMMKMGTGDVTQLMTQSYMVDEKITLEGTKQGEAFSLLSLSEGVIISDLVPGNVIATFKESGDGSLVTSISVIVEQQSKNTLIKMIWQPDGEEVIFPSMLIINNGSAVRSISCAGIPIVKEWLKESNLFNRYTSEILFGFDYVQVPKAASSDSPDALLPPSVHSAAISQQINLSTLADNEKKAQNDIDTRSIFYIWGEDTLTLLNADFKVSSNGLVQGFKITRQMVERLCLNRDLFSSDSRAKLEDLSLEDRINLLCGRWGFCVGATFNLSLFYGSNGQMGSKDDLETFLRNFSQFIQRVSGASNMVKMGVDKFCERLKEDEFLSASLHFFLFVFKQIIKRFAVTTNDPAFQSKSALDHQKLW